MFYAVEAIGLYFTACKTHSTHSLILLVQFALHEMSTKLTLVWKSVSTYRVRECLYNRVQINTTRNLSFSQ